MSNQKMHFQGAKSYLNQGRYFYENILQDDASESLKFEIKFIEKDFRMSTELINEHNILNNFG